MAPSILVTGGTGTLGRQVVTRLRDAGHQVRVLSRRARGPSEGIDFATGDLLQNLGIEAAVHGAQVIVHCAGSQKGDDLATANLVRAASRAGKPHLVSISVVGADRIPVISSVDRMMFSYFASKRAAELVASGSGLPWTTLRATQFHDLVLKVTAAMAKLPAIPMPKGLLFQPVDSGEVADRLVELALDSPAGLVPDMAGPRIYLTTELMREYLAARRISKPMVQIAVPGHAAGAIRAGAATDPARAVGRRTWEDFLADRVLSSV
ncbi:MAG: SDR family oxidoreductase [Streptosporangiaceae bacterium]